MNQGTSPMSTTTHAPRSTPTSTPAAGEDAVGLSGNVIDTFVTLTESLISDYDPDDLLTYLAERAVNLLGITAAGILLADPSGKLQLAASSSQAIAEVEVFQLSVADGPCVHCYSTGLPVIATAEGEVQRRWPAFAPAMDAHDLVSVVAVPLRARGKTLGVLGLFSTTAGAPTPSATRVAQGLADIATITLLVDRSTSDSRALAGQLQTALDSRVLIEQAKGVIAAQLGIPVADAFTVLRSTARRRGVRLADLSLEVVVGRTDGYQLDG